MEVEIKKKLNKKSLYAIIGIVFLGIIGVTFAYYRTNNTITNEFNAGKYKIKTEEVFVSPDNWQPGDVTEKKVNVKNEGTVEAAVKVCFREEWEDANGNQIPLDKYGYDIVELIYTYLSNAYWLRDCNDNKTCFYYYKSLKPNEVTEDLLESVRFYSYVTPDVTTTCTEDPVTHTKSCTSEVNDYSGGKYRLYVDIETVQYNSYQDVWGNVQVEDTYYDSNGTCKNMNILRNLPDVSGKFVYLMSDLVDLKDEELSEYDLSDAECSVIYTDSVSPENKYNRCYKVKYTDYLNHQQGERLSLRAFNLRYINTRGSMTLTENGEQVTNDYEIYNHDYDDIRYSKRAMATYYFPFNDDDNSVMNFTHVSGNTWNDYYGDIYLDSSSTFSMPNHGVLFVIENSHTR